MLKIKNMWNREKTKTASFKVHSLIFSRKNFAVLVAFLLILIWKLKLRAILTSYFDLHWVFSIGLSLIFLLVVTRLFLSLYIDKDKTPKEKSSSLSNKIFTLSSTFKENVLKMAKKLWNAPWTLNSLVESIGTKINFVSDFFQNLIRMAGDFSSWVFIKGRIQSAIKSSLNSSTLILLVLLSLSMASETVECSAASDLLTFGVTVVSTCLYLKARVKGFEKTQTEIEREAFFAAYVDRSSSSELSFSDEIHSRNEDEAKPKFSGNGVSDPLDVRVSDVRVSDVRVSDVPVSDVRVSDVRAGTRVGYPPQPRESAGELLRRLEEERKSISAPRWVPSLSRRDMKFDTRAWEWVPSISKRDIKVDTRAWEWEVREVSSGPSRLVDAKDEERLFDAVRTMSEATKTAVLSNVLSNKPLTAIQQVLREGYRDFSHARLARDPVTMQQVLENMTAKLATLDTSPTPQQALEAHDAAEIRSWKHQHKQTFEQPLENMSAKVASPPKPVFKSVFEMVKESVENELR